MNNPVILKIIKEDFESARKAINIISDIRCSNQSLKACEKEYEPKA